MTLPPSGTLHKKLWRNWARRESHGAPHHAQLLPSFFIIGPPRTGTSWLHEILKQHTVLPRLTKETRFFDTYFERGLNWYRAHYPSPNGKSCIGEIAPTYFASAKARQRIKELVPDARIVCTFRHPVERVLSLYRVKRAYGLIPWSFEDAILRDPELIESSRYAAHLRAWQQAFGIDHVLATLFDDLRAEPQAYVHRVADFIGIPRFSLTPAQVRSEHASDNMTHPRCYYRTRSATLVADWLKARHFGHFVAAIRRSRVSKLFLGGGPAFGGLSGEMSLRLQELFRSEVEELQVLLRRDLSAWKALSNDLLGSAQPLHLSVGREAQPDPALRHVQLSRKRTAGASAEN